MIKLKKLLLQQKKTHEQAKKLLAFAKKESEKIMQKVIAYCKSNQVVKKFDVPFFYSTKLGSIEFHVADGDYIKKLSKLKTSGNITSVQMIKNGHLEDLINSFYRLDGPCAIHFNSGDSNPWDFIQGLERIGQGGLYIQYPYPIDSGSSFKWGARYYTVYDLLSLKKVLKEIQYDLMYGIKGNMNTINKIYKKYVDGSS